VIDIPAFPFSPVKFSALIDLVFAFDNLERLDKPIPSPLNSCARTPIAQVLMEMTMTKRLFLMRILLNVAVE
jgi:hypothetical protein